MSLTRFRAITPRQTILCYQISDNTYGMAFGNKSLNVDFLDSEDVPGVLAKFRERCLERGWIVEDM